MALPTGWTAENDYGTVRYRYRGTTVVMARAYGICTMPEASVPFDVMEAILADLRERFRETSTSTPVGEEA